MRKPVQPPAHRVHVRVDSRINTENAEAWRRVVDSFGGSVELAFDSLLVNATPGLRLSTPLNYQSNISRLRRKVEKLENSDKDFRSQVDADMDRLIARVDVALEQIGQVSESLQSAKTSVHYCKARLTNRDHARIADEAYKALAKVDDMLSGLELA